MFFKYKVLLSNVKNLSPKQIKKHTDELKPHTCGKLVENKIGNLEIYAFQW